MNGYTPEVRSVMSDHDGQKHEQKTGDYGGEGIEAGKRLLGAALTPPSATEISLQHARHIKTILVRVCSCACCRLISVADGRVRAAPCRRLTASIPSPPSSVHVSDRRDLT